MVAAKLDPIFRKCAVAGLKCRSNPAYSRYVEAEARNRRWWKERCTLSQATGGLHKVEIVTAKNGGKFVVKTFDSYWVNPEKVWGSMRALHELRKVTPTAAVEVAGAITPEGEGNGPLKLITKLNDGELLSKRVYRKRAKEEVLEKEIPAKERLTDLRKVAELFGLLHGTIKISGEQRRRIGYVTMNDIRPSNFIRHENGIAVFDAETWETTRKPPKITDRLEDLRKTVQHMVFAGLIGTEKELTEFLKTYYGGKIKDEFYREWEREYGEEGKTRRPDGTPRIMVEKNLRDVLFEEFHTEMPKREQKYKEAQEAMLHYA